MMKMFLYCFCMYLTLPSTVYSNEIIKNVNPVSIKHNNDFTDLAAFGDAIGDKSIVFLDELTHGEKEAFALKSRIVKYLHQHKGFEVLILESGLYDVERIWKNTNKPIKEQAPGNIFYMYANDNSINDLFDYIDIKRNSSSPLFLSGFDSRLSGIYSNKDVVSHIEKTTKTLLPKHHNFNWQSYTQLTQKVMMKNTIGVNRQQQDEYFKQSYFLYDQLIEYKNKATGFNSPQYTAQLIRGIITMAETLWSLRRRDEHDIAMAENAHWLIDHVYQGKKVIIWGHYIHLNRQGNSNNRYDNLGSLLDKTKADDIYIAHFGGAAGQYKEFRDLSIKTINPLEENSFENQLLKLLPNEKANTALFIDAQDVNFKHSGHMSMFGHEYKSNIEVNEWRKHWDGMFFYQRVNASD